MRYLILFLLVIPMMGNECSSPDGSQHERFSSGEFTAPAAPVPEPSGGLIFGSALVLVAAIRRVRK